MRDFAEEAHPLLARVEQTLKKLRYSRGARLDATDFYSVSLTWPSIEKGKLILRSKITSYPKHNRPITSVTGTRVFENDLSFFQKITQLGLKTHKTDAIVSFETAANGMPSKKEILVLPCATKQEAHRAADAIKHGYA